MDDVGARAAYERMLAIDPKDADAADALERTNAKRAKWRELLERYVHEAQGAGDSAFRSSLLVSAAEVVFRYGRGEGNDAGAKSKEPVDRIVSLLRDALHLDPKNRRAEMLLERLLRDDGRWDDVAEALERFASEATQKDEKIAGWLRLARTFAKKLKSADRAAAAYERVLDVAPGNAEAASFLSDHFTTREMWEHLVALYEGQLSAGALRGKEEESGRDPAGRDGPLADARAARGRGGLVRAAPQARPGAPGDALVLPRVVHGARRERAPRGDLQRRPEGDARRPRARRARRRGRQARGGRRQRAEGDRAVARGACGKTPATGKRATRSSASTARRRAGTR